ncbi:MAG: DUF1670 domain-containing protein [Candidatus Helarchaeota archaeon]
MAKNNLLIRRLQSKTQVFRFATRLNTHYNLSLAAAELLSKEILDEVNNSHKEALGDGQIWYTAIHKDEPAGKSLAKCRKIRIKLTLHHADDIEINDTRSLKSRLVFRLPWEAVAQKSTLTVEDLSRILFTGEKTIRRLLAEYREKDIFIPLRGYYKDIGPGITHKSQAVRLYLKGFSPSKIANYLGHHIQSIERYLNDFCVVMMGIDEGYSATRIARHSKLSERLVKEYQALYYEYNGHTDYQVRLSQLQDRLAYLLKKKNLQEDAL